MARLGSALPCLGGSILDWMCQVLPWEEVLVGLEGSQIPRDDPHGSHQGLYGI